MYVSPIDARIIKQNYDEIQLLNDKYKEMFGEYLPFNPTDFPGTKELLQAEQYIQILRNCVETGIPCKYDDNGLRIHG